MTYIFLDDSPSGREGMVNELNSSFIGIAGAMGLMVGAGAAAALGLASPSIIAAGVMGPGTAVVVGWVREKQVLVA